MTAFSYTHLLRHIQACAKHRTIFPGKKLHAHIVKSGAEQCGAFPNTLIDLYAKCGLVRCARKVFDKIPQRDHVSWASILSAYNQSMLPNRTLGLFPDMYTVDHLLPDEFVLATLVKACASLGNVRLGKQVHGRFIVSKFNEDYVVKSSLVDMYSKCELIGDARVVFESVLLKNYVCWTAMISGYARNGKIDEATKLLRRMPLKNLFSWTALISGVVQSGCNVDAMRLFVEMRREEGIRIEDPFVLSSAVAASANLAALELGKQVHCFVIVLGYVASLFVGNALVDMYAKCSDILAARSVFDSIWIKDVVSWTSIIVGVAQHGQAEEALSMFDEMLSKGLKPNEVTFVGLIYACSHAGLVAKGRELFNSMIEDYHIMPSLQHYTCFLDLLSRSGLLTDAYEVVKTMPFEPDEPTWAALLSASKLHKKTQLAIKMANHLLSIKPQDPSSYILISNTYAAAGMWDEVSKVRKMMATMAVRKEPGYSWVNLGKESQTFYAGEIPNHLKQPVLMLIEELIVEMKKRGYVPDTSSVLHDLDNQEKEQQLFQHSERLAVAYGLLKSISGTTIRIVKNLRICGDCHTFLTLVGRITHREIIVRDSTRYHHFKDGSCSCGGFW
ncbi:hypothetical protein Syun_003548 [Stephania yunnanensis]|uniref:DYW domain-containing protein n=1 Tax=Stephania yunnanensis TaxID=152371 RepID=A0AAP0L1M7_9MAGN